MRSSLLLLSLFAIATLASIAQLNEIVEIEQQATLLEKLQSPKWTQLFIRMEAMIGRIKNVQKRYKLADTSVECVCFWAKKKKKTFSKYFVFFRLFEKFFLNVNDYYLNFYD